MWYRSHFLCCCFLQTTTDNATTATTTEIYASNNKALPTIAIITPIQQRQKPVILAIVIGRYREESREREGACRRVREVKRSLQNSTAKQNHNCCGHGKLPKTFKGGHSNGRHSNNRSNTPFFVIHTLAYFTTSPHIIGLMEVRTPPHYLASCRSKDGKKLKPAIGKSKQHFCSTCGMVWNGWEWLKVYRMSKWIQIYTKLLDPSFSLSTSFSSSSPPRKPQMSLEYCPRWSVGQSFVVKWKAVQRLLTITGIKVEEVFFPLSLLETCGQDRPLARK